ncbi:unnamed protein product [Symbiodinium natans]|uniref:Uncharacterized protein n=1 Tax=Symbiodinium natans TaxID=878477 RepID=A0A812S044_9DINO|nr:unnamed protein product [Symbiodinium natans]
MPGLPGGLGLRTPLGEHRAPGASQEPRETLIKTYGDSGMPHEVLFEIGLVQMETGFTWSACIQPFVCDFSSSMQIVTPSRNLQSNLPVKVKVEEEKTRLEAIMLKEVEETKAQILEEIAHKKQEEEEKEKAVAEERKKEEEEREVEQRQLLALRAKVDEERLKELEHRQEAQRKERQQKAQEEQKKAAETSRLLNTKGQRTAVGFKLKPSVL